MRILKKLFLGVLFSTGLILSKPFDLSANTYQYQLYQNFEKFGLVVFPKSRNKKEITDWISSIGFQEVASGKAVMRYGTKKENMTLMMPFEVQQKFDIKRFIVLQILSDGAQLMVGIFDPKHGLTLPNKVFLLDEVKKNIPKTLDVFRKETGSQKIHYLPYNETNENKVLH